MMQYSYRSGDINSNISSEATRMSSDGEITSDDEEHKSFIQSAASLPNFQHESVIDQSRETVKNALSGAKSMAQGSFFQASNIARNTVTDIRQKANDAIAFTSSFRYALFLLLAASAVAFLTLALLLLPTILFGPQKFAILISLSSLCLMSSLLVLKGFVPLVKHCTAGNRLFLVILYISSVLVTLYTSLFSYSVILVLASGVSQVTCAVVLLISYIPGGMSFITLSTRVVRDSTLRLIGYTPSVHGTDAFIHSSAIPVPNSVLDKLWNNV